MSENIALKFLGRKGGDYPPLPVSSKSTTHVPISTTAKYNTPILLLILLEIATTVTFSIYYDTLNYYHNFLGATLLGGSTAVLAQTITEYYKTSFSVNKHFKFLIWGFINGIFSKLWLDFILVNYSQDNFMKITIDQLLGNPIFQFVFVIYNCIWENNDFKLGLQTTYLKTMKYSLVVFPASSTICFTMLPENYIFPVNCLVTLTWNVVLSFIS